VVVDFGEIEVFEGAEEVLDCKRRGANRQRRKDERAGKQQENLDSGFLHGREHRSVSRDVLI